MPFSAVLAIKAYCYLKIVQEAFLVIFWSVPHKRMQSIFCLTLMLRHDGRCDWREVGGCDIMLSMYYANLTSACSLTSAAVFRELGFWR